MHIGGYADIIFIKRLLTLFLGDLKSGKFLFTAKTDAIVDAFVACIYTIPIDIFVLIDCFVYACVRLLHCSFSSEGHTRASSHEMSNCIGSHAFFV